MKILGLFLAFLTLNTIACPIDSNSVEKIKSVNLHVANESGLTESDLTETATRIRNMYAPIFQSRGLKLTVESNWNDDSVTASSTYFSRNQSKRVIYVSGGEARKKYQSKDGLLLTFCHEIGHNIGGFPKKPDQPLISSEGQSDYFATSKCMKEFLRSDEAGNELAAVDHKLSPYVVSSCQTQFVDKNEFNLCLRLAAVADNAGKAFFYRMWDRDFWSDSFLMYEPSASLNVAQTDLGYPSPSCRAATLFSGSLCNKPSSESISDLDETTGVCHQMNGDQLGSRPGCWFAPSITAGVE